MKTQILSILVLIGVFLSNAQNVNIPDINFKNALISAGVDTDKDGEISHAEAKSVTSLDVSEKNILNMTGIEAFANLSALHCNNNKLTSLDVSDCSALENLWCIENQLTSLVVSGCDELEVLGCWSNQLTSLDVSNNTTLRCLMCFDNQIPSLDVTNNAALNTLMCGNNLLTFLNISNNLNLVIHACRGSGLDISFMPSLYEVCVWEIPFPVADVELDTTGSPNVYFTTDCSITDLSIPEEKRTIDIYPNPSDDIINIEIENIKNAAIEIYNVSGTLVLSKALDSKVEKFDISDFPKGIYLVKVRQEDVIYIEKVVVR